MAHSGCWRSAPRPRDSKIEQRTRDEHTAVYALLDEGLGLLECARRLGGWSLNCVKRFARAERVEELLRPVVLGNSISL